MRRSLKKICLLLSVAMITCSMVACGNKDGSDSASEGGGNVSDAKDGEFSIHYLTARSMEEGTIKALMKVADMYKEEHPDFNFEVESIADRTAYLQKVKILASSDELPEMFDSDADTFFENLVNDGQIADIDALYNELGVTDKVYDNAKEYQRLSNGYLGLICWQANTEYFWYNKKAFEKANITDTPKTFDEFLEVCEKLKAAGITPISMAGGITWPPLRYLAFLPFRETGNDFIEKAKVGDESFGSETGMHAADFMVEVAQYFQPGWNTADSATAVGLVTSGEVAMTYDGTWQVPFFVDENKELKEDIGYFTLPILGENDTTAATDYWAHSGIGTAISQDAMDDNMKDFIKFVFDHYAEVSMYDFDTLPSFELEDTSGMSDFYKELMDNYSNVKTYGYCWDVRIDSASNEVLGRETPNLALGNITPEEWAKRMDDAVAQNVKK